MLDTSERQRNSDDIRDRIGLIPYCWLPAANAWSASDELLHELWEQFVADDTAPKVWDSVTNSKDFVTYMQRKENHPVIALVDEKPVAIAWLNNLARGSAFSHHAFTRSVWGRTLPIASQILDYWFSWGDPPMLNVLIGVTPKELRLAKRFAERLGFKVLKPHIPHIGGGQGSWISYLERETWVTKAAATDQV